ncbi:MAG: hypothetical protein V8R08_05555 [Coriobacteriales bacterium]
MRTRNKVASSQYGGILPSHTKIDIWESYAKNVLKFIDERIYGGLIIADKPDLQDDMRSLGVEVVQALSNDQQQAEALFGQYAEETDEAIKEELRKKVENNGAVIQNGIMFGPNGVDSFDLVQQSIVKKFCKLNSGEYQIFDHNHLFVRATIYANNEMLVDELLAITNASEQYAVQFENIIVSVPSFNYIFDLNEGAVRCLPFSSGDQCVVAEKARSEVIEAECSPRS